MPSSTSRPAWHNPVRNAVLWAGILTGPLVWLTLLEVNYLLTYVACETGDKWFMHAAVIVAVGLVGASGYCSWIYGPPDNSEIETPPVTRATAEQRARWMALYGMASSVWFIIVILSNEIPILVLESMRRPAPPSFWRQSPSRSAARATGPTLATRRCN